MPLYELFGLAKPLLERSHRVEILRSAATAIFSGGGVLADIKSYGDRDTAYSIRPPGQRYDQVGPYTFLDHLCGVAGYRLQLPGPISAQASYHSCCAGRAGFHVANVVSGGAHRAGGVRARLEGVALFLNSMQP